MTMIACAERAGACDLLDVHRWAPARYPFLLQSAAHHPQSGRYDLLFGDPGEVLRGAEIFTALDCTWRTQRLERGLLPDISPELPFIGGWFLLLGYEAAGLLEPRLRLPASPYALPDAIAVRCRSAMIHDRKLGLTTLLSEHGATGLAGLCADFDQAQDASPTESAPLQLGPVTEEDPQRFTDGVRRIVDYLHAGDLFQANLSRAWHCTVQAGDPASLYTRLRASNPAPFAGLARFATGAVVSSSPERLVSLRDAQVDTRPIAGTRPRGRSADEDLQLRQALIGNLKERAEHVMLIDLERNDLGRVCVPGSVAVNELMTVESYAHVHHIVSNVRGRLRTGVGPAEVLRAVFPGGTITGCPKLRAMEVIAELEGVGRGPYTGAMGYLSLCGRMDSNILIRSLVLDSGGLAFRAGAGIVADSQPDAELAETRSKARGLLLALQG